MSNAIGLLISEFENSQINDHGTGAFGSLSLWTPVNQNNSILDGYYALGLYGTNNYATPPSPTGPYYVFEENDVNGNPILDTPAGFTPVWTNSGNDRPSNLGIYNIVPRNGYVGIGCIAVMNFNNPPSLTDYGWLRCVSQYNYMNVTLGQDDLIWTDHGSGASCGVSLWRLPNSGAVYAHQSSVGNQYPETVDTIDIIYNNNNN